MNNKILSILCKYRSRYDTIERMLMIFVNYRNERPRRKRRAQVLINRGGKGGENDVRLYSQVVLPLERLAAHRAHVLPLVAVRQLVLRERRCVVEHLAADLQTETVLRVTARLCVDIPQPRQSA